MMRFYDFLFFLIYKFYSPKEKGSASSSAGIIGGLQAMNMLTILILALGYLQLKDYLKVTAIILFIFFQITTYVRYIYKENNSAEAIEKKWSLLSDAKKKRYRLLNLVYITLSIALCIGSSIFISKKY